MSGAQSRLYNAIRNEELLQLENLDNASQRMRLRALSRCYIKLLQLASNPMLISEDVAEAHPDLLRELLDEGVCPKIEWACTRARELAAENKKVIIWSSFVRNVELIANRLQDLGAVFIHGGVDAGTEDEEYSREGNMSKAREQWLRAGKAGCSESYNELGNLINPFHDDDSSTNQDLKKAQHYYELAAMMGDVAARYFLGLLE